MNATNTPLSTHTRILTILLALLLAILTSSCGTTTPSPTPETEPETSTETAPATSEATDTETETETNTETDADTDVDTATNAATETPTETETQPDILLNTPTEADGMWVNYVSPDQPNYLITAPAKKRNLLVIEVESLETSLFTRAQGGVWDHEVISELYQLLFDKDAIFFASDSGTRGTQDGYGTTWTTASLVSNTSGLSFKVPTGMNNSYQQQEYLRGAYALGDVLQHFGYRNVLLSGCRTTFGGVKEYFSYHGNYEIIDSRSLKWNTAAGEVSMTIPDSQVNEWGFSDEFTFDVAKRFLSTEGNSDEPWHLFISTIDTHFTGYLYEGDDTYTGSVTNYSRKLDNVYATTSRVIGEFVEWLKEQSFYENTTVVIIGDHVNMLSSFCSDEDAAGRGRYNLFLNSAVTTTDTKNRSFTAFDFYPSMLAAAGFTIQGDRLALGTSLFSGQPTLAERYGLEVLNAELESHSEYYIDYIMGREHYEDLEARADN